MSFILDALKKAEAERNRDAGPVLMEARLARTRQRLPGWAWALGCILLANLAALAWTLLRRPPANPPVIAAPAIAAPAPAVSASPAQVPVATAAVAAPLPPAASIPQDVDHLPTLQDLLAAGITVPALQLNLHVYDEQRSSRYVLLNAKRVREGDEVTAGIRVEQITPRGVVLDFQGRRFLMLAGG